MNRTEKIELLKSIQNGTPLKFAFVDNVTIYNTLDEPDVYYNELIEMVSFRLLPKALQQFIINNHS